MNFWWVRSDSLDENKAYPLSLQLGENVVVLLVFLLPASNLTDGLAGKDVDTKKMKFGKEDVSSSLYFPDAHVSTSSTMSNGIPAHYNM